MESSIGPSLHITVATSPAAHLTLEHDLRLLKAALLYGDKVKLCSLTSSLLVLFSQIGNLTDAQRLEALESWSSVLGSSDPSTAASFSLLRQLKRKRHRNREELLFLLRTEKQLNNAWAELEAKIEEIAQQAGAQGLVSALESGVVEVEVYPQPDIDDMMRGFLDSVGQAVACGETYPLLDDQTGELVRAALQEGELTQDRPSVAQGRIVGLASDILQRLPLFDDASVEEILSIREELDRPLIRFRSAIIEYSRSIASAQWDPSFRQEADLVFRERVAPAILDIEDAVKSNQFVRRLLRKIASHPILPASSTAIGLLVSQVAAFSSLAGTALGLFAGTGTLAYSAFEEWQERHQDIQRNQVYFYYRAGQELRKRSSGGPSLTSVR